MGAAKALVGKPNLRLSKVKNSFYAPAKKGDLIPYSIFKTSIAPQISQAYITAGSKNIW
jgi:hypothetical protein